MAMANKFELGLLPERKLNWRFLVTSYGFEILMVVALINAGLIWPERLQIMRNYHVTELIPLPDLQPKPLERPKAPPVRVKLLPAAPVPVFQTPKLTVPREVRVVRQKPEEIAPPKIVTNQFPQALKPMPGGARTAKLIRTGEFGSSATPTVNAPIQKVQTGGFGDPNGVKGTGKPNAHLTIASTGSFDLPPGAGQGNGAGGAKGIKGTVASAGFGNGIAQPGQGDGRSNGRGSAVQTGSFGTQELAQGGVKQRLVESGPPTTPVEIISKPNPVYTQEARQLKLEGEVLLAVMFGANGQLHVEHVVRGLGHGLDESAVAAADMIRFKPALRNGTPVDSTAVVHVVFRLAY
jgi:TonB family protein